MIKSILSLLVIFVCTFSNAQVSRTLVTQVFTPVKDNTIYENTSTNSNALGGYFTVGVTNGGSKRRGLMKFDLSPIPPGSIVTSVVLMINMNKTRIGAIPINLHKLNSDWGEGTSNAGSDPFGFDGSGTAATLGDATWLRRFFNTTSWTTSGGDFSPTISATTSVNDIGPYTWSGAQMNADVQAWINNSASNFGWLFKSDEAGRSTKRFISKDNGTPADRPTLTVQFSFPLPVTLSLFQAFEVNNNIFLKWQTQEEYNHDYFLLEHSTDAISYNPITRINNTGISTSPKNYEFLHTNLQAGNHYYRLKQTDINGRIQYSKVLMIQIKAKLNYLTVAPNPVSSSVFIKGIAIMPGMNYYITNAEGAKILSGNLQSTEISMTNYPAGIYFLTIINGPEFMRVKFQKQ